MAGMVDSFGYTVMSLDHLIETLQGLRDKYPQLADRPVWVDNCPPLKWPVKFVGVPKDQTRGLAILVERGGN